MSTLLSLLAALTLESSTTTQQVPPPAPSAAEQKSSSIAGQWQATHPNWKGRLELRADGRFTRQHGGGGKWRLRSDLNPPVLELDWDDWAKESARWISPDLFKGKVRGGELILQRVQGDEAAGNAQADEEKVWLPEFDAPELKRRLVDSVWKLKDGKHFTLHADGSTAGSWHDRKGKWRIVGPDTVQLQVKWKKTPPETVRVEKDGEILRWSDEAFGEIAKREPSTAAADL